MLGCPRGMLVSSSWLLWLSRWFLCCSRWLPGFSWFEKCNHFESIYFESLFRSLDCKVVSKVALHYCCNINYEGGVELEVCEEY